MPELAIRKRADHLIQRANRVIDRIENVKAPFSYFILTYLFALTLRHFVEPLSTGIQISLLTFTHYYLAFTALALALILLFHLATDTPVAKVARVILPAHLILVLAPSLDLLISGGKGLFMTYLLPGVHDDLLWRFLTFFGDFEEMGVTPGIRIELAIVLLGSFVYFLAKTSRLIWSLGYTFLTYAVIFIYSMSPFVVKAIVTLLGLEYEPTHELLIDFFAAVIFLLGSILAYLGDRQRFISIVKDIRWLSLAYYLSMFALGVAFAASTAPFKLTATNISDFLFIPISLLFASLFSILTNNMADYEIDRISHPDRPLVSGSIRFYVYQRLAWPFLGAALFYAIIVNFTTLFFVTLLIGNYFLYSMPPFRLKRVTFFSKLVISVNSLAAVMLGVLTITDSLYNLPAITFPIVLIGITAVANFLDINDYHGDKQGEIRTLPVLLGLTRAKRVIGSFFILTYGALFLVIDFLKAPLYWLPVFVFLGIIQFFLTNRKRYNEDLVLGVILLTIWLVIYLISRYASAVI